MVTSHPYAERSGTWVIGEGHKLPSRRTQSLDTSRSVKVRWREVNASQRVVRRPTGGELPAIIARSIRAFRFIKKSPPSSGL